MPENKNSLCIIDTNIWLYAFIDTDVTEKSNIARKLISESKPVITIQIINEICVNLIKKASFNEKQITQLVEAFHEKYPVFGADKTTQLKASDLREHYRLSFWDSMIVASALCNGISSLYTEDIQHGLVIEKELTIENPFIVL